MSWSAVIETSTDSFAGALSRVSPDSVDGEFETDEGRLQVETARIVAKRILEKGALGEGRVRVVLSGHANPGNAQPGRQDVDRAPDRVVVSIERVDEPEAPKNGGPK